jgi:antitoxin PrlF
MNRPLSSRLTSKGQATIPVKVRQALQLKPGDRVAFEITGRKVALRRLDPLDHAFLSIAEESLTEWSSAQDEKAFSKP